MGYFSTGLPGQEERACGEGRIVETSVPTPEPGCIPGFRRWGRQRGAPASEVKMETTFVHADRETPSQSRAGGSTTATSQLELSRKIATLTDLTAQQLRTEWRRLYRSYPPRLSRDLLVRTIAYRMQELAYGGLSKATQRKLVALTKELQTNGGIAPDPGPRVRPGARLVREWRGRTHTVVVTEEGFEFAGKTYSSLSKIAQTITGAHWSGPRFFGLNRGEAAGVQSALNVSDAIGEGDNVNG